jgi:hypothetical protein
MDRFLMHTSIITLGLTLVAGTAYAGGQPGSGNGRSGSSQGSRGTPSGDRGPMNQGHTPNQLNTSKTLTSSKGTPTTKGGTSQVKYTPSKHFDYRKHGYKSIRWDRRYWSDYYHCYCYWAPSYRCWCFYEQSYACYLPVSYYRAVYPDSYQPTPKTPVTTPKTPITTPTPAVTSTPTVAQQTTVVVSGANPGGDGPAPLGNPAPPEVVQQTKVAPSGR